MKVAIVGSRDFTNYESFKTYLEQIPIKPELIVSGGSKGTDKLAERYAKENKIELKIFYPDWEKYGLSAGPLRNQKIVDSCDIMIAFPSKNGKGTQDSIRKCNTSNKKCFIIELKENGYEENTILNSVKLQL